MVIQAPNQVLVDAQSPARMHIGQKLTVCWLNLPAVNRKSLLRVNIAVQATTQTATDGLFTEEGRALKVVFERVRYV